MKKCVKFLIFVMFLQFFAFVFVTPNFSKNDIVIAQVSGNLETWSYYDGLSGRAKLMYDALKTMSENSQLKNGVGGFDLISSNIVTQSDVSDYAAGDTSLVEDFKIAKYAFELDSPEIFYVNFDKINLSFSRNQNTYFATIDAGREDNFYAPGFSSIAQIDQLLNELEETSFAKKVSDFYNGHKTLVRINNGLVDLVEINYSLTSTDECDSFHLSSAYGAIGGKANSLGVAKIFKILAGKIGINSVIAKSYLKNDNGTYEVHYFNYVYYAKNWYVIDVSLNDKLFTSGQTESKSTTYLYGQNIFNDVKLNSSVSGTNFAFNLPTLAVFKYSEGGINYEVSFDYSSNLTNIKVGYMGQSALELDKSNPSQDYNTNRFFAIIFNPKSDNYDPTGEDSSAAIAYQVSTQSFTENFVQFSKITLSQNQWASFMIALTPTRADGNNGVYLERPYISSSFTTNNTLATEIIYNPFVDDGVFPDTNAASAADNSVNLIEANQDYVLTLTYPFQLNYDAGFNQSNIKVKCLTQSGEDLTNFVKISDLNFENNRVSFNFNSGLVFNEKQIELVFEPVGLVGEKQIYGGVINLAPTSIKLSTFNQDDEMVSLYGLNDVNFASWVEKVSKEVINLSNYEASSILLVNSPLNATQITQKANDLGINFSANSQRFGFDLSLLFGGKYVEPNGSVKLLFKYPDEIGDKSGVFKVYHVKDDNTYEILTPILTKEGFIIETSSFSSFIVEVKSEVTSSKIVAVTSINAGGKVGVKKAGESDTKGLASLTTGQSAIIQITPEEGFVVDYVLLNNVIYNPSSLNFVLSYNELEKDSLIKVAFVSQTVKTKEEENELVSLEKDHIINLGTFVKKVEIKNRPNVGLIIGLSVAGGAVVFGGATAIIIVRRRKIGIR